MKPKVVLIERKGSHSVSIERVFRQISRELGDVEFDLEFQSVPYGNGVAAIIKNLLFFKPHPAAVYHITGDVHYIAMRLPRNRTLLTIHDLVFLRGAAGIRRWVLKKLFLDIPLGRVRHVSTISKATAEEVIQTRRSTPHVIENPLLDGFNPKPERAFDSKRPAILQVGAADNKNLAGLVAAVAALPCRLRIVGRLAERQISMLAENHIDYENVSELDERQMVEEYRNSDILYFCSTYEGFGLPIIEAQAMRKPVITSDIEPMKSVAGAGAAFADPANPGSIRAAIEKIASDAEYREQLIRMGEENITRFSPKRAADAYAALYRQIIAENS